MLLILLTFPLHCRAALSIRGTVSTTLVAALLTTGWRIGAAAAFHHYLLNHYLPPPLRQTARCRLASCPYFNAHLNIFLFLQPMGLRLRWCHFHQSENRCHLHFLLRTLPISVLYHSIPQGFPMDIYPI